MNYVTQILSQVEQGDGNAAEELLPLVYDELRRLAARKMAEEKPGQTLQATALVHEAYIRLFDVEKAQHWDSRGHFFAAAAEAMRRILVDNARRKRSLKGGGAHLRQDFNESEIVASTTDQDILALDEALAKLAKTEPQIVDLVKLRFFAGRTIKEAAQLIGVSSRTADEYWSYAKAWLLQEIENAVP